MNFTPYLNSFRTFYHFLQAFKTAIQNPLYVGDFADVSKVGYYINQTPTTKYFWEHNPYECRLGAQYERLHMEMTYLEEIYYSVYKRFLSDMGILTTVLV